jgi:hypothetical protein
MMNGIHEVRTNKFINFGGKRYPASGRPIECELTIIGENKESYKPQVLTVEEAMKPGFAFCAAECGKCMIIIG